MLTYLVYAILVFTGIYTGRKRRENLIYLLFVLFPFQEVGNLRYIQLQTSTVITLVCIIPMLFYLFIDVASGKCREFSRIKGVIFIFLLFSIYLVYSYTSSVHPLRDYFLKLIGAGFLILVFVLLYYRKIDMNIIIKIAAVMILFQFITALLQTYFNISTGNILFFIDTSEINAVPYDLGGVRRAMGTFNDPNYFALYIAVLTSSLLHKLNEYKIKLVYFIGIASILLSFSRMGTIACLLLAVFYIYKCTRWHSLFSVGRLLILLSFVLIAGFYIYNYYESIPVISTLCNRFMYNGGNIGDAEGTRDFIVKAFFSRILGSMTLKDIIFGLGLQSFEYSLYNQTGILLAAHNEYIQIFADIGLLGCLFLLSIPVYIYIKYASHIKLKISPHIFSLSIILFGLLFLTGTYELYLYFYISIFLGREIYGRFLFETKSYSIAK